VIRLLDGAVGTELTRRGFVLAPPSFSGAAIEHAPALLAAIHRDYVDAGAQLVTAGTTCVHRHWLGAHAGASAREAVALARASHATRVAGALAMLPSSVDRHERAAQYRDTALALAEAGVDVIVCESFVDPDELALAVQACAGLAPPRWAAVVPQDDGDALGGAAIERVLELDVAVIAVHCCSLVAADAALGRLRTLAPTRALAAYPSTGSTDDVGFARELVAIARRHALAWIGACCGSTPATIAALRHALDHDG
jgi:S-methylmethionine-dependent homocysteine/selenocysteine methylase